MPTISETVTGMDRIIAAGAPANLLQAPLRDFFSRVSVLVQNRARTNAAQMASDTGQLAGSIASIVDSAPIPLFAQVGSNLEIAPFIEFGTGRMGDPEAPYAHKGSHRPPSDALIPWVHRKGLVSGVFATAVDPKTGAHRLIRRKTGRAIEQLEKQVAFLIARAIWRRGGLRARAFLRKAYQDSAGDIQTELARLAKAIGARWGEGGGA